MTTLTIDDDVATALTVRAQEKGLSLESFLTALAQEQSVKKNETESKAEKEEMTGEELVAAFRELAHHGPSPTGTFPRSEIYKDHD